MTCFFFFFGGFSWRGGFGIGNGNGNGREKRPLKALGFISLLYISYVYAFGALLNFKFLFGWGGGDLNLQRLRADDALVPSPIVG